MAIFPNLRPSARSLTLGQYPMAVHRTAGGYETRVQQGDRPVGTRLQLTFQNVLEDEVNAILLHYTAQKGSVLPFPLGTGVMAGSTVNPTPSGQSWKYADAPSVNWVSKGIATVGVSLEAVS